MKPDVEPLGPKDVFLQSLKRCERDPQFLERFYERFLASSPEVRTKFLFTDFQRQRAMLQRSLQLIAVASDGHADGLRELNARAETHSRAKLDIAAPLYELWLETLIHTARESDSKWTPDVEHAWRDILGIAIRHMLRKYEG